MKKFSTVFFTFFLLTFACHCIYVPFIGHLHKILRGVCPLNQINNEECFCTIKNFFDRNIYFDYWDLVYQHYYTLVEQISHIELNFRLYNELYFSYKKAEEINTKIVKGTAKAELTDPFRIPLILHYVWITGSENPYEIQPDHINYMYDNYMYFGSQAKVWVWVLNPSIVEESAKKAKMKIPTFEVKPISELNIFPKTLDFMKKLYLKKLYAKVSDFARFYALYEYGGIFLDFDMKFNSAFIWYALRYFDTAIGLGRRSLPEVNFVATKKENKSLKKALYFFEEMEDLLDSKINFMKQIEMSFKQSYIYGFDAFWISQWSQTETREGNHLVLEKFQYNALNHITEHSWKTGLFDNLADTERISFNKTRFYDDLVYFYNKSEK